MGSKIARDDEFPRTMKIPGYQIKRTIGKGGMATIYLALRSVDDEIVALKTVGIVREVDVDADVDLMEAETQAPNRDGELNVKTRRFLNEGRIIAGIQHPNIVKTYDVGATPKLMFLAMEYVAGGTLRDRMKAGLNAETALNTVIRIGAALNMAHSRGVVHRDVKPANILFREDGTPLLSDFGIAQDENTDLQLTATGAVVGSPLYVSPEQAGGEIVDHRTDIYSLGVVLFEMLAGRRPFDGKSAVKVLMQHLQSPVPLLPERVEIFQGLVDRMMAKEPENRYRGAGALVRDVAEYLQRSRNQSLDLGESPVSAPEDTSCDRTEVMDSAVQTGLFEQLAGRFRNGILEDLEYDRLVFPSLPDVVLELRAKLQSPDVDSAEIARVISADPALSAQLLRVANSAFYAGQGSISDIQRAVVRLGGNVVQQVVMMLVVAQLYDLKQHPKMAPYLSELWRHSTHVAAISKGIAQRVRALNAEIATFAGLIHAIGALPVLVWAEQIPHIINNGESVKRIIKLMHGELGGAILKRWRYAEEMIAVPEQYENPKRCSMHGDKPDYVDIVQMANLLARAEPQADLELAAWRSLPSFQRLDLDSSILQSILIEAQGDSGDLASALGGTPVAKCA